jgi:hypothetical protein
MAKIYTVHIFDTLNSNGFGYILTAHTRLTLPDGREAMESVQVALLCRSACHW